jgi:multiple sugar transport system permease protein
MTATTLHTPAAGTAAAAGLRMRAAARRRRIAANVGSAALAVALIVWTITPIFNMVMVSLESHDDVFSSRVWPAEPSAYTYWQVVTQGYWYLEFFWEQYARSIYLAAAVSGLVLLIASLASFTIGRMRIRYGWLVTNAALLTYVIPSSFLAIPFYRIMQYYGMMNNLWSVIAALVTFATPYAIFIFQNYGASIPIELDESARIDGASPIQIYFRIYLPLMTPALVAVGTYAMLLAWNDYLYQFLLLSNKESMTVPVALAQFLNSDEAPWNLMMATAVIYALPPLATYYMFRNKMTAGLTMGGVKG